MKYDDFLSKPIWQMTGADFMEMIQIFRRVVDDKVENDAFEHTLNKERRYVYGIAGLANLFKCSLPTANRIKKSGVIDEAITQIGRKIIVDADLALQLVKQKGGN